MLFSSLEFLFLFLPLSIAVYFLLPRIAKNAWLFVSGLLFYGFGEPKYLPIMLLTILADYIFGLIISKLCLERSRKIVLWCAVIYNVVQLAYFKFISNELPIGISFYSFQALSYVIDVYRKKVERSENLIDFGAYVALYPQLIAGPIVRYSDVATEMKTRKCSLDEAALGARRFVAGLSKKVLLANAAGEAWSFFSGQDGVLDVYVGVFFFAMQIYFDFSGYSDMAQGLGLVFGFHFPDNFNYPYISKSITDFWRRWHITLSSFFKEYVYISLGGNRCGKWRTYLNLLITWGLTGIWHGASLNFLLWGLYFALILILEKSFLLKYIDRFPRIFRSIYALTFIGVGWLIFASDGDTFTVAEGGRYFLQAFGVGNSGLLSPLSRYELLRRLPLVFIMIIGATPLPKKIWNVLSRRFIILQILIPAAVFVLSVAYIVNSGYNPFLYFRF